MRTWARMARQACSDCGAAVVWTTAIDLPKRVDAALRPLSEDERKRLWDAINWCGPDAEAWWCEACSAWGVFEDQHRVG